MTATLSKLETAARQISRLRRLAIESDPERETKQRQRRLRAFGQRGLLRQFFTGHGEPGQW